MKRSKHHDSAVRDVEVRVVLVRPTCWVAIKEGVGGNVVLVAGFIEHQQVAGVAVLVGEHGDIEERLRARSRSSAAG